MALNPASYHELELEIARNPADPRHILPPRATPGSCVLDIGCGAGQTLLVAFPDCRTFGIDIDEDALRLGHKWNSRANLLLASAEDLPFSAESFDVVVSRVTLPLTNLPRSIAEIQRVLRPGGKVWLVLHPPSYFSRKFRQSSWKGKIYCAYILLNSLAFILAGGCFSFRGHYESFQTAGSMRRALQKFGFTEIDVKVKPQFVATAKRPERL